MKLKKGFTLIELTVALLAMGFTAAALLNMLDFSLLRFNSFNTGRKTEASFTEIRMILREIFTQGNLSGLNRHHLDERLNLPTGFYLKSIQTTPWQNGAFVNIKIYEDKNRNNAPDPNEISSRLFFFRKR